MNIEIVPIDSIQPDPANVRTHSERNIAAITASLKRFGQQTPVVVDGNGIVRKGNGTLQAAKLLGLTEVKIVRTNLTGSEATAYAIADNRTGDPEIGSGWDNDALAQTLAALKAEDSDLAEATGFTAAELSELFPPIAPPEPPADFQEFDETIHTDYECPRCQFKWSGKARGE